MFFWIFILLVAAYNNLVDLAPYNYLRLFSRYLRLFPEYLSLHNVILDTEPFLGGNHDLVASGYGLAPNLKHFYSSICHIEKCMFVLTILTLEYFAVYPVYHKEATWALCYF